MKFSKILLLLIIPLVVVILFGPNISSVSTVLLGIKGTITDGNLIKFSGTAGVGEDAGVAASNVTKNKFDATSAPTVNNDTDEGYTVGSKWYDVTADKGYVCMDNTDGAAVWIEITSLGTTTFTGLTDTPANYTGEGGKVVKVNSGEDALEFGTAGANTFTALTDTPANYTGEAGKYAKVNVGENALEFGTPAGESNTASNIGAEVEIFKQKTGVDLEFRTLKADSNKILVTKFGEGDDIDIGSDALIRSFSSDYQTTYVNKNNPANLTGKIKIIKVWAGINLTNFIVATFYVVSGNNLSTRDSEFIGNVTAGSEQTFEVDLDVSAGDYIGYYNDAANGYVRRDGTGDGQWKLAGDHIPCTDVTFTSQTSSTLSIGGTGDDAEELDYIRMDIIPENVKLDDFGAPDDNTDNDTSTTAHGLMPKLPFSGDLLSTTTVAFNADADTTLYTVPTGKRCVLFHAVVVAAGDAGATTTVSIGANGAETDFVPANTLSNLDAQYDSVILTPIPNTTPLKIKSYAADTVIEAQVASQSGVAGNTIYLFGILY